MLYFLCYAPLLKKSTYCAYIEIPWTLAYMKAQHLPVMLEYAQSLLLSSYALLQVDLKPSLHCSKAVATAMRVLSMIRRTFVNISKDLFVFLYKTYIKPHLEYFSSIWSPSLLKNIEAFEKVQRQATKMVRGYMYLSYEKRLKSLNSYTLFRQHHRGDLIKTYKILNGYYDIDSTKFFILADAGTTRGHHMKLYKYHIRLNLRSNFLLKELLIVGIIYHKR